ncbi:MAG: HAD family hydrolase [Coprobacillaceae bacterium]
MNKKYFFFDIDGTLTDNVTKQIVPSAYQTLHDLQTQGHFVCIATGRAHYKAVTFMKEIGLYNMVCSGGNGLVINNTLIENKPLQRKQALAIVEQAESLGYGILIALDDSKDVYSKNDLFLKQAGRRKEPTKYIFNQKLDYGEIQNFHKIYISIPIDKEKELTLKDTLGYLRFEMEYLMFQPDNKKQGIIKMMDYLGGNLEDVVVFGDDYNDLDMFDAPWTKVAMGNACDALKQKADYITDKNIDDGIYNICRKMKWVV